MVLETALLSFDLATYLVGHMSILHTETKLSVVLLIRALIGRRGRLHRFAQDGGGKIHAAAASGMFNVFMGEFNFSDLPEPDLMRSIRLFGETLIPALREFEPF